MRVIHFSNDTPLTEGPDRLTVTAEALCLGGSRPDHIIVNGYSYTDVGGYGLVQLYKRDHDGVFLIVTYDPDRDGCDGGEE